MTTSDESDSGNGNGAAHPAPVAQIVLEYEMASGTLRIGGAVPSIDVALNILQQALRFYEHEFRQVKALEFAARAQREAENERIRAMVSGRKG